MTLAHQPVFATPLILAPLGHSATARLGLIDLINTGQDEDEDASTVVGGAWRGRLPNERAEVSTIVEQVVALATEQTVDIAANGRSRFLWRSDVAALRIPCGGQTIQTIAPHAFWSAICCIDDGLAEGDTASRAGAVSLEDPRMPLILMEAPRLRFAAGPAAAHDTGSVSFQPTCNQIMLFPGWLRRRHLPHCGSSVQRFVLIDLIAEPV